MSTETDNISFDLPKSKSNTIKVIGVGGGGSNAVDYMFDQKINGVDFVICNTDSQALNNSPIPNKIQLGAGLTSGLGAGANPEIGAQSAHESVKEIQQMLNSNTKMVFVTAGMGGGTGTGAAPIIAKIAKEMGILVVAIVTVPFQFEGKTRLKQAQKGVIELRKHVDSLIVINNNKLREVYGNLCFREGYSKADEVLSTATKGIAEVITNYYTQNIDLHDAKTVLSNSGTAIMGSAKESGKNRAQNAIIKALDSPLLDDNKITGAKNVLLLIVSGAKEITLDEIGEINEYIQEEAGNNVNIIMGVGEDKTLEDAISVTVVATGFTKDQQQTITNDEVKKIVHILEDEQEATYNFDNDRTSLKKISEITDNPIDRLGRKRKNLFNNDKNKNKDDEKPKTNLMPTPSKAIKNINVVYDEVLLDEVKDENVIVTNTNLENPAEKKKEEAQPNLFDLPADTKKNEKSEESNPIKTTFETKEVKDEKKYLLEDFDVEPTICNSSMLSMVKEEVEEELQFDFEINDSSKTETIKETDDDDELSPLNLTISELQAKAQERRKEMKKLNYKFNDNVTKSVDEMERVPAYLRKKKDLEATDIEISKTKTILQSENNEITLSSDNSYLDKIAD